MEQLSKTATRLKNETKHKLLIDGFDDLNVMRLVDKLYADIDTVFQKRCRELYFLRYREVCKWLGRKEPEEDVIDELFEMELAGLLDKPNENTHYVYTAEILRKRDRAKEAILAVPTRTQKQIELDKQLRYVMQMDGWYLDFVSQDAEIQAFEDSGIEFVQRHEMNDGKTCRECKSADGDIYRVGEIPKLPHLRCRRWFEPV